MTGIPLDLAWASDGYLFTPDGRGRHFLGVGRIVQRAARRGVRFYWGEPPGGRGACSLCLSRRVVLAPWLIEQPPWYVRYALTHELFHCIWRGPCEAIQEHQQAWFGDEVMPEASL